MILINGMTFKQGDVFNFRYTEEYLKRRGWEISSAFHCFDGQLVAVPDPHASESGERGLILRDTYWAMFSGTEFTFSFGSGRVFSIPEALHIGTLDFVCNLSEIGRISRDATDFSNYYEREDFFNLSYQHSCYPLFALKRGAVRSEKVIREVITEEIRRRRSVIESELRYIEHLEEKIAALDKGKSLSEIYI